MIGRQHLDEHGGRTVEWLEGKAHVSWPNTTVEHGCNRQNNAALSFAVSFRSTDETQSPLSVSFDLNCTPDTWLWGLSQQDLSEPAWPSASLGSAVPEQHPPPLLCRGTLGHEMKIVQLLMGR